MSLRLAASAKDLSNRLPALMLAAKRAAENLNLGLHGRKKSGLGDQFWQYRPAVHGDQFASIDWRQSARAQQLYVREQERSVAQTLTLWVDKSPSMDWSSQRELDTKIWRSMVMALALADLALRAGEKVSIGHGPLRMGISQFQNLAQDILNAPSQSLPDGQRAHSSVVVFSDFLDSTTALLDLKPHRGRINLVQILDPAEMEFSFSGRIRFKGLENEGTYLAKRAEDLGAAYKQALAQHREDLAQAARQIGASLSLHRLDHAIAPSLLMLHQLLSQRA